MDPSRVLARIIGDLQDPSGRVAMPGFYDNIEALLRPPHDPWSHAPSDPADAPSAPKLIPPSSGCEADLLEAIPVRLTCDIDNIDGSRNDGGLHQAPVPRAFARLSFHLICDQHPDVIRVAFREFARARVPSDYRIEFTSGSSIRPVRFDISHPAFRKARDALTIEWGRQAVLYAATRLPPFTR